MTVNGEVLVHSFETRITDLEDRADRTDAWGDRIEKKIQNDIFTLLKVSRETADKVDALIIDVRGTRVVAQEARDAATAARLDARDARSAIPPMRQELSSYSTEIEGIKNRMGDKIQRVAEDAAKSNNAETIRLAIVQVLADQELERLRSWRDTIIAVGKKSTLGLLALSGTSLLHFIRLVWLNWHH